MNQKESEGISRALELASRVDEMVLGVHQLAAASAACLARVQHEAALPLAEAAQHERLVARDRMRSAGDHERA